MALLSRILNVYLKESVKLKNHEVKSQVFTAGGDAMQMKFLTLYIRLFTEVRHHIMKTNFDCCDVVHSRSLQLSVQSWVSIK
jgi:hypothetical protein